MKKKTLLIAAVMFFALSAAAYAQVTFQVGSIPVTAVTNSGQTEKTGSITFTPVFSSNPAEEGTISINYGVPITIPFGDVQITGTLADFFSVNTFASSNASGVLVLDVEGGWNDSGSVTISGVRVATAGTSLSSLTAQISATGNAILAGQNAVVVINSITNGLGGIGVLLPPNINAVAPDASYNTTVNVTEGFLNAYGVTNTTDPSQTGSTMVRLTLSALPPAGVTVTFPATADTTNSLGATQVEDAFATATSDGAFIGGPVSFTSQSTSLAVWYRVSTDTAINVMENLSIPVTISISGTAPKPLPAATVTVNATLAPIGPAFGNFGAVLTSPIPRYAEALVGPAVLFNIVPGTTTLLFPYATTALGFDTGIAISNTTTDPGTSMGFLGAVKQDGTIKFYFYPQTGSPITYTTSASSPGLGLDSGVLRSGRTYAVLLSELLAAAQGPADFSGYVVAVCNFTNGHSQYFVTNFSDFANGSIGLVIHGSRRATPEALDQ